MCNTTHIRNLLKTIHAQEKFVSHIKTSTELRNPYTVTNQLENTYVPIFTEAYIAYELPSL